MSGEWWVQAPRPPKISAPETPLVLAFLETLAGSAFLTCHVSLQRQLGLAVGQVRNASWLGVSMWLEMPRALAFLKGSNREILPRRVQFVTINVDKVRTVISSSYR